MGDLQNAQQQKHSSLAFPLTIFHERLARCIHPLPRQTTTRRREEKRHLKGQVLPPSCPKGPKLPTILGRLPVVKNVRRCTPSFFSLFFFPLLPADRNNPPRQKDRQTDSQHLPTLPTDHNCETRQNSAKTRKAFKQSSKGTLALQSFTRGWMDWNGMEWNE